MTSLGEAELKVFEQSTTTKLNGFTGKLQAALINMEADVEVLDGLKIAVEANGASFGVSDEGAEFELGSISVKVVGDFSEGLGLPKGMTVSVDGRLTLSLDAGLAAGLAARLGALRSTHLKMMQLSKELERVGGVLEREVQAHRQLLTRRDALAANRGYLEVDAELRNIEKDLAGSQRRIKDGVRQVDSLSKQLDTATKKATTQMGNLRGKLTSGVARAMRSRVSRSVAKAFAKVIPVVNMLQTVIDVTEVLGSLAHIASGETGDPEGSVTYKTGEGSGGPARPFVLAFEAPVTHPSQASIASDGPVRHPDGSSEHHRVASDRDPERSATGPTTSTQGEKTAKQQDPLAVAENIPSSVLESWFVLRDGDLVETGARIKWMRANAGFTRDGRTLRSMRTSVVRHTASWGLEIEFAVEAGGRTQPVRHSYIVTSVAGRLDFFSFILISSKAGHVDVTTCSSEHGARRDDAHHRVWRFEAGAICRRRTIAGPSDRHAPRRGRSMDRHPM